LKRGLDPNVVLDWAETIEKTAKKICNDPDCKRIKFKYTEENGFEFVVSDKEAADCIIRAILEYGNSQSILIQEGSRILIEKLEETKAEFE
ncbi:MAG TPA: hypothetical protein VFM31_05270, partial [Nitrososphaeraceae archaeon]|nr:hypothetical protein [Nitrososphaeraceae archaeon]